MYIIILTNIMMTKPTFKNVQCTTNTLRPYKFTMNAVVTLMTGPLTNTFRYTKG